MRLNIQEDYKRSLEIIKKNRKIIYFFIILEILFLVGGTAYYSFTYSWENLTYKEQRSMAIASVLKQDHFFVNFIGIFPHNAIAALFRIVTGIVFAYGPLAGQTHDAIFWSYAMVASVKDKGVLAIINWMYVPFERLAFIIASSLGTSIFLSLFKPGSKKHNLIQAYKDALIVFLLIILPALLIAGIIESFLMAQEFFYFTNTFQPIFQMIKL